MRDEAGISGYYDRLSRWNRAARLFGYGGGRESLTVHRPLADPRAEGRPTTTRLHDILVEHLAPAPGSLALDAGCGMGGTMIDLSARLQCRFVGLTLSPSQAESARRAAQQRGLADRVSVLVQNYDTPPVGPFALIVAIESLAHSPDPQASIAALAAVLEPGGILVIVDDMPEPAALSSLDFQTFVSGWKCPNLTTHDSYVRLFERLGLAVVTDRDLTGECRPRSRASIARLMWWNRVVARVSPVRDLADVMESHLGGLALERLTRDGLMRYRLLIARHPPAIE